MTVFEIIYCTIVILVFVMIASCLWYEKKAKISPTPVLPWVRRRALSMASNYTDKSAPYQMVDLGCGWGGLVVALAKRYPSAHITGYEISYPPYLVSKLKALFFPKRVKVTRQNFMMQDISHYDVVFCYLSNHHMRDLAPKFLGMKKGAIIVSCSFAIPDWTPVEQEVVGGLVKIPVYLYRV